jgi:hypothetical protein
MRKILSVLLAVSLAVAVFMIPEKKKVKKNLKMPH